MASKKVFKILTVVHRWLGVLLSALFLMWYVSGIVMMYWGFPAVSAGDRLAHLPPLDAASIKLSPEEALAALQSDQQPSQVKLNTFDGRPVYRFAIGRGEGGRREDRGDSIVYADDGSVQSKISTDLVRRVAAQWTGLPIERAREESVTEVDQWTVGSRLRTLRPLYKYSFDDGQQVYVSGLSGEVMQYTTSESRFWAYLGAVPHWIYFVPLRKHQEEWSQFVIWTSGVGTVAGIIGIAIAIWLYSPAKRYRYAGEPSSIPYRGQKRWHTMFGLVFGLTACTWAFSGMASMGIFPNGRGKGSGEGKGIERVPNALGGGRLRLAGYTAKHPRQAVMEAGTFPVREIEFTSFAGEPIYMATAAERQNLIIPVNGAPMQAFDTQRVIDVIQKAAQPAKLDVTLMEQYDFYYLDRLRNKPLPVLLVKAQDSDSLRYYVDPKTARVVGSYNTRSWTSRWLYHGLHSLDFPWLYNYRPLWDIVVILFMTGGTALCVTSLVLTWRVLRRKGAQMMAARPAKSAGGRGQPGHPDRLRSGPAVR